MKERNVVIENILSSKTTVFVNKFQEMYMSHFAYACKMRCPLNLVLENSEYLWFY